MIRSKKPSHTTTISNSNTIDGIFLQHLLLAVFCLFLLLFNSHVTHAADTSASKLAQKNAEQNNPAIGIPKLEKPIDLIILEKKAQQGDPAAQFDAALYYFKGVGIEQSIPKTIHYLELASQQKYPKALYNLATLYLDGKIVPQDIKKGLHLLQMALEERYAPAYVAYAFLYLDGKIVPQNIEKSYQYILQAEHLPSLTEQEKKELTVYRTNIGNRLTQAQRERLEHTAVQ